MPRALPILVAAILTPAGTWHVGAPGLLTAASAEPAACHLVVGTGQAAECSIVGRGQDGRDAMPDSQPSTGERAAPEERRPGPVLPGGAGPRAPPVA